MPTTTRKAPARPKQTIKSLKVNMGRTGVELIRFNDRVAALAERALRLEYRKLPPPARQDWMGHLVKEAAKVIIARHAKRS